MQSENRLFDDFVKMVNGVAGTFAGMGREAEASAREKFREWMAGTPWCRHICSTEKNRPPRAHPGNFEAMR